MKINLLSRTIAAATLLLAVFTNSGAKAQTTPFPVNNPSSCNYTFSWSISDNATGPCVVCDSGTGVAIAAGTNITIPFLTSCTSPCDFTIIVTGVGTTVLATPVTVSTNGPASGVTPVVPGCPAAHVISVSPAGATFN